MIARFNQLFTVAAASLTRFLSNATGATWTLSETTTGDDLAHQVTIRNDSATDHSAKTAILVGTDANDEALTETLNLPGTSATVTSTKFFKTLTSVTPSATIGADTMDIGIAATARSPAIRLVAERDAAVGVIVGGTINYDVVVFLSVPVGDAPVINHPDFTAKTADVVGAVGFPATAIAVDVNSHTSGTFRLLVNQ